MASQRTILLVEDDDDLRRLYRQVLMLAGHRVIDARGGFEALQRLESESPDLIVLDLLLPGIDGKTFRQDLATRPETRTIPILVVTGTSATARDLDVDCVLTKPIQSDDLLDAVSRCLDKTVTPGRVRRRASSASRKK